MPGKGSPRSKPVPDKVRNPYASWVVGLQSSGSTICFGLCLARMRGLHQILLDLAPEGGLGFSSPGRGHADLEVQFTLGDNEQDTQTPPARKSSSS